MAKTLTRKKFMPFPPNSMAPSTSVSVASGGITSASFAAGAIDAAAIAAGAIDAATFAAGALVGQLVKSVQYAFADQTSHVTAPFYTLPVAVNLARSVVIPLGVVIDADVGSSASQFNCYLSTSTKVQWQRWTNTGNFQLRAVVLEFW